MTVPTSDRTETRAPRWQGYAEAARVSEILRKEAVGGALSDEDPEVEEVAWVPLADVREQLAYADERRLMDRLPDLIADAE